MICNGKETSFDELVILLKGGYTHAENNFSTFMTKKLYQYRENYYFAIEYSKNHLMIAVAQKIIGRKDLKCIITLI